jgi:cold shock CspA family protein
MGRSSQTFSKSEKEKKKRKKREDKALKREERKANSVEGNLDNMMAYVDENGQIVDTPPDLTKKKKIKAEDIMLGVPIKEEEDPIHEGKVTFFNSEKGYGFIKDLLNQESYFVHVNGLKQPIDEGDKVRFELIKGEKGLNAINVTII